MVSWSEVLPSSPNSPISSTVRPLSTLSSLSTLVSTDSDVSDVSLCVPPRTTLWSTLWLSTILSSLLTTWNTCSSSIAPTASTLVPSRRLTRRPLPLMEAQSPFSESWTHPTSSGVMPVPTTLSNPLVPLSPPRRLPCTWLEVPRRLSFRLLPLTPPCLSWVSTLMNTSHPWMLSPTHLALPTVWPLSPRSFMMSSESTKPS
mmetsp:Transcript_28683/g.47476  ORF Transcript_28683/g.47476 Transcript_28683/m.47476 type:complete len:202 (-) Transcript_28683:572-1177(-)